MKHFTAPFKVSMTNSSSTSGVIDYRGFDKGEIYIPSGGSSTSITWYTCATKDGTFLVAKDVGTNGAVTVAVGYAYQIPTALAGAAYIMGVLNASETISVGVTLKD
jgi:hypothetical protein